MSFWVAERADCIGSLLLTCKFPSSVFKAAVRPRFRRYEGQLHCTHGYLVLALAFTLSAIDLFAGAGRVFSYARTIERGGRFSIRSFWNRIILSHDDGHVRDASNGSEYTSLVAEAEEAEDLDEIPKAHSYRDHRFVTSTADDETAQWVDKVRPSTQRLPESPDFERTFIGRRSRGSQLPDETLQDQNRVVKDVPFSRRLGQLLFLISQRFLVLAGYAQLMHGVVIYTGGCRGNYFNGCLAHMISKLVHFSLILTGS